MYIALLHAADRTCNSLQHGKQSNLLRVAAATAHVVLRRRNKRVPCCLQAVSKSLHALKHAHFDFIFQKANVALLRTRAALWKQTTHNALQACDPSLQQRRQCCRSNVTFIMPAICNHTKQCRSSVIFGEVYSIIAHAQDTN
jgi:hypothetical protein